MKVEEYVKQEIKNLEDFKDMWNEQMELDPDMFPEEIEVDEWDEQYTAYYDK